MVRVTDELVRDHFQQSFLNLQDIFAGCKPSTIGEAEYVCIHRHRGFTEGSIEHDVRCFSANAG